MRTCLVTLNAIDDDEVVAECQGEIDLDTFEITDLTDQSFTNAAPDLYDGYNIVIEDKAYPVAVDFMPTGNEFMIMDADGVEAITRYAYNNPDEIDGEPDEVLDDFDDYED